MRGRYDKMTPEQRAEEFRKSNYRIDNLGREIIKNKRYLASDLENNVNPDHKGVVYLDMRRMKEYNSFGGQDFGDDVVAWVADMVGKHGKENGYSVNDTGDEFIIRVRTPEEAAEVVKTINKELENVTFVRPDGESITGASLRYGYGESGDFNKARGDAAVALQRAGEREKAAASGKPVQPKPKPEQPVESGKAAEGVVDKQSEDILAEYNIYPEGYKRGIDGLLNTSRGVVINKESHTRISENPTWYKDLYKNTGGKITWDKIDAAAKAIREGKVAEYLKRNKGFGRQVISTLMNEVALDYEDAGQLYLFGQKAKAFEIFDRNQSYYTEDYLRSGGVDPDKFVDEYLAWQRSFDDTENVNTITDLINDGWEVKDETGKVVPLEDITKAHEASLETKRTQARQWVHDNVPDFKQDEYGAHLKASVKKYTGQDVKSVDELTPELLQEWKQKRSNEPVHAKEKIGKQAEQIRQNLEARQVEWEGRQSLENALRDIAPKQADDMLAIFDSLADNFNPELKREEFYRRMGWQTGGEFVEGGGLKQQNIAPVWYSQLSRTLEQKMPNKASAQQVRGIIAGVVKGDELKWTGFDDWLNEHPNPTKAEALEFLRQSNVTVEEKVLGKGRTTADITDDIAGVERNLDNLRGPGGSRPDTPEYRGLLEEYRNLKQELEDSKDRTQYATYTLPGGTNYRELLFKFPKEAVGFKVYEGSQQIGPEFKTNAEAQKFADDIMFRDNSPFSDLSVVSVSATENYNSPHFGNEGTNLLAHVRFDDRVDADGKKVLFVEEVQSDWHQEGREKGYNGPVKEYVAPKNLQEWDDMGYYFGEYNNKWVLHNHNGNQGIFTYYKDSVSSLDKAEAAALHDLKVVGDPTWERQQSKGVPQAPFSKTWDMLVMKRMIRWAAENGYDKVAWTTGKMQADRYNLATQVKHIAWELNDDGTYNITAPLPDGRPGIYKEDLKIGEVKDLVGKEITDKILSGEGRKDPDPGYRDWRYLEGEDLAVGGAGMRQFYDVMLPSNVDKYIKKWGAKVGETKLEYQRGMEQVDGKAQKWMSSETVHSFDVTPTMRESALAGQPLFQDTAGTVHGITTFTADMKAIIRAYKSANISTFAHELIHGITPMLKQADADIIRSEWKLISKVDLPEDWHTQMTPAGKEFAPVHTEVYEWLSRAYEKYLSEGVAPTSKLEAVFARVKDWMLQVYQKIKGSEIDVPLSDTMRAKFAEWMGKERTAPQPWQMTIRELIALPENKTVFEATKKRIIEDARYDYAEAKAGNDPEMLAIMEQRYKDTLAGNYDELQTQRFEAEFGHIDSVTNAASEGKLIPPEVQAEYPGIDYLAPVTTAWNETQTFSKMKNGQTVMFGAGEDSPLFSGTPETVKAEVFKPAEAAPQDALFNMREQVKGIEAKKAPDAGTLPIEKIIQVEVNPLIVKFEKSITNKEGEVISGLMWQKYSGDSNATLRQQLIEAFTGEKITKSKAGITVLEKTYKTWKAGQTVSKQPSAPKLLFQRNVNPNPPGAADSVLGDSARMTEPPVAQTLLEGYLKHMAPTLRKVEQYHSNKSNWTPAEVGKLPKEGQAAVRRALGGIYTNLADTRMGAVKWAEGRRNFALLDYTNRTGFDNLFGGIFPYQYWYTRSAMNWALRAIDKPSIYANYYRLKRMGEREQQREGYPTRLKGKMGFPAAFLPEGWGDTIFADPLRQTFPFAQMLRPFENMTQTKIYNERRAEGILQQMVESGQVDQYSADQALQTKTGPLWERAINQAELERDPGLGSLANPMGGGGGDTVNPLIKGVDAMFSVLGPSLPISIAWQAMTGRGDHISKMPVSKFIKAATGWDVEGAARKAVGASENDVLETYAIDKAISDLAGEGVITAADAKKAMIERRGKAWEQALQRAQGVSSFKYFGSLVGADIFPEGEKKMRELKLEYDKARQNKATKEKFWEDHPEYSVRIDQFNTPEERLHYFLIGQVWDKYGQLTSPEKKNASAQFGEMFTQNFLDSKTRAYGTIDNDTLAYWAKTLGAQLPSTATPAEGAGGNIQLPAAVRPLMQQYEAEKKKKFPNLDEVSAMFYSLPAGAQDKKQFPIMAEYDKWKNRQLADHPALTQYLTSDQSELFGLPVQLQGIVYQYRALRDENFPDIFEKQTKYFSYTDTAQRRTYLEAHPELESYWTFRKQFAAQNPQAAYYILGAESLGNLLDPSKATTSKATGKKGTFDSARPPLLTQSEVALISPSLRRQLWAYYNKGDLSQGAMDELGRLQEIWKMGGVPKDVLLSMYLRPAIVSMFMGGG
ncbi:hypothetical protein CCP3SC15_910001 [Gammaproteobacteria bacterium]